MDKVSVSKPDHSTQIEKNPEQSKETNSGSVVFERKY